MSGSSMRNMRPHFTRLPSSWSGSRVRLSWTSIPTTCARRCGRTSCLCRPTRIRKTCSLRWQRKRTLCGCKFVCFPIPMFWVYFLSVPSLRSCGLMLEWRSLSLGCTVNVVFFLFDNFFFFGFFPLMCFSSFSFFFNFFLPPSDPPSPKYVAWRMTTSERYVKVFRNVKYKRRKWREKRIGGTSIAALEEELRELPSFTSDVRAYWSRMMARHRIVDQLIVLYDDMKWRQAMVATFCREKRYQAGVIKSFVDRFRCPL